jgi:hypothetical protein
MVMKKRPSDPHGLAERIIHSLTPLQLSFSNGRWYRTNRGVFPKTDLEAIVSRLLREELDRNGDTARPVTSALVREILLALAGMLSPLASHLVQGGQ